MINFDGTYRGISKPSGTKLTMYRGSRLPTVCSNRFPTCPTDIEIELRRLKNMKNLGLAVIDYLQLIKNNNKKYNNREQELADISRTLKLLSLELDIPIIALCQLNRNASRTEPTLADIRESGAIEQDADNVIFLYKQNADEDTPTQDIVVDLQKQRNGCTGTLNLRFVKRLSEFRNLIK